MLKMKANMSVPYLLQPIRFSFTICTNIVDLCLYRHFIDSSRNLCVWWRGYNWLWSLWVQSCFFYFSISQSRSCFKCFVVAVVSVCIIMEVTSIQAAVHYIYQCMLCIVDVPMYTCCLLVAIVDCTHVGFATAYFKDLVRLHRRTLWTKQQIV